MTNKKKRNIMMQNNDKNKQQGITNILLVGVDGNHMEKDNRLDAMIIVTIEKYIEIVLA